MHYAANGKTLKCENSVLVTLIIAETSQQNETAVSAMVGNREAID